MFIRYTSSIGAGAIVTVALIYWMQLMIATGDVDLLPSETFRFSSFLATAASPSIPPPRPIRAPRPEDPVPPEGATDTSIEASSRTGPTGPIGPIGPPGLTGSPGRSGLPGGRAGPWISDGDLISLLQVKPNYPYRALTRDIEGYVVVEFTVNKTGKVRDVVIVESSHRIFESAARAAAAKFRYQPRVVNGMPVGVAGVRTRLVFELDN